MKIRNIGIALLLMITLVAAGCRGHRGHGGVDGKDGKDGESITITVDPVVLGVFSDLELIIPITDITLLEHLQSEFEDVKVCYEARHGSKHEGEFKNLTIVLDDKLAFECKDGSEGVCSGIFQSPNILLLSDLESAYKHEVMHYLRVLDEKKLDDIHTDEDWDCV